MQSLDLNNLPPPQAQGTVTNSTEPQDLLATPSAWDDLDLGQTSDPTPAPQTLSASSAWNWIKVHPRLSAIVVCVPLGVCVAAIAASVAGKNTPQTSMEVSLPLEGYNVAQPEISSEQAAALLSAELEASKEAAIAMAETIADQAILAEAARLETQIPRNQNTPEAPCYQGTEGCVETQYLLDAIALWREARNLDPSDPEQSARRNQLLMQGLLRFRAARQLVADNPEITPVSNADLDKLIALSDAYTTRQIDANCADPAMEVLRQVVGSKATCDPMPAANSDASQRGQIIR